MKNKQNTLSHLAKVYRSLQKTRPLTRPDLKNYLKVFCATNIPDKAICPDHQSPMDYLWHAYNCDFDNSPAKRPNGDVIVWANRGGGKTVIAAIATLLDCLFKPNCQTRILAGSLQQSSRMYEYLTRFIAAGFEQYLDGKILKHRCAFNNGSNVEILTQSAKNIRGRHIHKLRCDEIELFDADVFAAAQFITKSTDHLTAAMEAISTMHVPYGLMQQLVKNAPANNTPVMKWCLWETIEKCRDRSCSQCPLWTHCQGKAKHAEGYLKIDDCITQMRRSSSSGFETEMLCKRPSLDNVVFADFDPEIHVKPVTYDPNLPLYRAIDFGFVNPFVCLWLQVDEDNTIRVIDEYQQSKTAIAAHAEQLKRITPCPEASVAATFCDPAGAGRNDVTGTSPVNELRHLGITTKYRKSGILQGIELIRRALRTGDTKSHFLVNPKCTKLIEAMQCYHYPHPGKSMNTELPEKDGVYDHPIDALRYFFIGLNCRGKTKTRRY